MNLCTFTQVAELRRVMPVDKWLVLVYTPARSYADMFSFLAYEDGDGVLVEPLPDGVQPKQWTLPRADLDHALAALVGSVTPVTVGDESGVLTLSSGTQSFRIGVPSPTPAPRPVVKRIQPPPTVHPLPSVLLATSQTYRVLDGLLTQSELFSKGIAQVKHDPTESIWDIRTSAQMTYRVQPTDTATEITIYLDVRGRGKLIETLHLPPLPLHEQHRLLHERRHP